MPDPPASPIQQLLDTMGLTRADLKTYRDQMRDFLLSEDSASRRVPERDNTNSTTSHQDSRSTSRTSWPRSSLARSISRASSSSLRDATPPATPIKSEPQDSLPIPRHMDNMEMVIERQRRQNRREKKERKEREREIASRSTLSMPQPPSPSPGSASRPRESLTSITSSLSETQEQGSAKKDATEDMPHSPAQSLPPITPQRSKYYRDHTNLSASAQKQGSQTPQPASPTPTRARTQSQATSQPLPTYPQYVAYPRYLPAAFANAQSGSSALPITPQPRRVQPLRNGPKSPLPPSSPPPMSSPLSSPNRRVVNLVSSPGPMNPLPDEEEYDKLPYTLPPGPYSPNKPDLSYAALVGQAILSSPEHRLTLQEIYDWITIVYPHFKRGETTWMNSIRHVLSTTVCFRKVTRERAVGRTLWAIWDEDLECFKGGGFRKQLCKDIANALTAKGKSSDSKGKGKVRKRDGEEDATDTQKAKRVKKEPQGRPHVAQLAYPPPTALGHHPLFPPTRPTPHHQPYYESCLPQPQSLPTEVIFPPLPAGVAFSRVYTAPIVSTTTPPSNSATSSQCEADDAGTECSLSSNSIPPSSVSSVPELTPNRSSSSPPISLVSEDVDMESNASAVVNGPLVARPDSPFEVSLSGEEAGDDHTFFMSPSGKGHLWKNLSDSASGLQPGIKLSDVSDEDDSPESHVKAKKKGKGKAKAMLLHPVPTSPTFARRATRKSSVASSRDNDRSVTPPPAPSTPPQKTRQLNLSSVRTPISHKGLHMSPSASLAHYKSHLDPPPVLAFPQDEAGNYSEFDPLRTPSRKEKWTTANGGAPITPKKLTFSQNGESPFRNPFDATGVSPFRTPRSRGVFDPHDPSTLLEEELNRMGGLDNESPGGLFGKGAGTLLYDSPGTYDSPGKWTRWW